MRHELLVFALVVALAGCGSGAPRRNEARAADGERGQTAAEVNVSLGQAYLSQNRLELALSKLQKALKLDPKLPSAHTVIAVLYERIGDEQNAAYHYKRATELAGKSGPVLNNYGTFLCHRGRYEEADGFFERALSDPFYETPVVAYTNRGACAMRWGKLELAEKSVREALRQQPANADALYHMATILFEKRDYFHARAYVQRYEAAGQAGPESLQLAMNIESGLGNQRAVREYRNRLLTEFPESEQARSIADSVTPK